METACFRASLRAKGRKRVRVNPNLSDKHCFGGIGIGSLIQTLQEKERVIHMKKEYQKPLVACTDVHTKETISNAPEYQQRVFCANPEFVCREIAGEMILVPNGKAAYDFNGLASVNSTGAFLWKLLERERTFQELCAAFAREYDLTDGQSAEDVSGFLRQALMKNMVLRR